MNILNNIHVVNLDRCKDRLIKIHNRLNNLGLKYTRFSATDGKKLSNDFINKNCSYICKNLTCNRSLIGCWTSHKLLWQKLINSNENYYLIMEDDCVLTEKTIKIIKHLEEQLNNKNCLYKNFDIISLYCNNILPNLGCNSIKNIADIYDTKLVIPLYPLSTTCYIISKKGAYILLKLCNKINTHIDVQIANKHLFKKIKYYLIKNSDVTHDFSEISTVNKNNKSILLILLNNFGFNELVWKLQSPILSIKTKYDVSLYSILIITILIINLIYIKNKYLTLILLIEFILSLYY